jgi:hypothetical protein
VKNQTGMFRRYALDSSFFIDLFSRDGSHPRDRYIGLWEHFEGQVDAGEIIAPVEVREELTNSLDDALDRWLVKHRTIFIEVSRPQLAVLQAIVRKSRHSRGARRTWRTLRLLRLPPPRA